MNTLVIGSGGREHAMAWAAARSPRAGRIYVAPGNGGTDADPLHNVDIPAGDTEALVAFAKEHDVGLTLVGPEAPLAEGMVDVFTAAGLPCFGPRAAAARLEASKAWAKEFMARHSIPTATFAVFDQLEPALAHLDQVDYPVVVKASGLAAGKGVLLPEDTEQARLAVRQVLEQRTFGHAGDLLVIEQRLVGQEASVLAFCDGQRLGVVTAAQDHKRVYNGDRGPNTGGMGAVAPTPAVTPEVLDEVVRRVLQPVMDGMAAEGCPYVGVLYAGVMLTASGPSVLEFNVRLGDPETQVVLPLLDADLLELAQACVEGRLDPAMVRSRPGAAATVVASARGYPGSYDKGLPIDGLQQAAAMDDVVVFHAGTRRDDAGQVFTSGGRVLAVTGLGPNLKVALSRAYQGLGAISFEGIHFRTDIGHQALG